MYPSSPYFFKAIKLQMKRRALNAWLRLTKVIEISNHGYNI